MAEGTGNQPRALRDIKGTALGWLVDDIEAALAAAVRAGGEVAHPPLTIPGHGTFAIYIQGGIQHGLWQL